MPAESLATALTARFGPPSTYLQFRSWKIAEGARAHVHAEPGRCTVYVSDRTTTTPRLLVSISTPEAVPQALRALEQFVRDRQGRSLC